MTGLRVSAVTGTALGFVAAATTWAAMLSWRGFTEEPGTFLVPLLVLGGTVAGAGALGRWARLPVWVVFPGQVLLSAMVTSALLAGSPLPLSETRDRLVTVVEAAVSTANRFQSPVPVDVPPVDPLLIAGGLACFLLVDLLACGLGRISLAGLPLLTVYSVPVSVLGGGISWWVFVLTAIGFMSLLFIHENEQISRWGRPLRRGPDDTSPLVVRTGALRTSAGAIGGVATAVALALPLAIPTLTFTLFDFGRGPGGSREITVENPSVDLQRNLTRGEDVPLVRFSTADPDPSYLRIAVLTVFSENEWKPGDRNIPTTNRADGPMPPLDGVDSDVLRRTYGYDVSVTDEFRSAWLPTMSPVTRVVADGDWRFDPDTMDFLRGDSDLDAAGLEYSMRHVELDLQGEELAAAASGSRMVSRAFLELPPELPDVVRSLATEVTREEPTRFQKAVALQEWFRTGGGFSYDDSVELGDGTDDLARFLSEGPEGRTGYCEQFAASMAVMARVLGVPSRVAVGFLTPDRIGESTWEYSAHDMHAWPELFIAGAGWVRFEPTPAGRAGDVPAYTRDQIQDVPSPSLPTSVGGDSGLDRGADRPADRLDEESVPQDDQTQAGVPWGRLAIGIGVAALLGAALMVPRTVRAGRRRQRLSAGPEAAWLEIRDTVVDLGLTWPAHRSPRQTRDRLVRLFGAPADEYGPARPARGPGQNPDAVLAVDRLVGALEQLRYSGDPDRVAGLGLAAETETCLEALTAGATPRARRRATWFPRSVFVRHRAHPLFGDDDDDGPELSLSGTVDHAH